MRKRRKNITSVITGDIINSRKVKSNLWLRELKKTLAVEGHSPKSWEIFRGDSFQVEVENWEESFSAAIRIKATVKAIKNLDVRMAIGIGKKGFAAKKITESNGEAFINSGETLELLKKEKCNLAIKTQWPDFDKAMNLYFKLALIAMDNWTTGAAELIKILIVNQEITQTQLAKKIGITQSSVSERKRRAFYSEIMELESLYKEMLNKQNS